jgi:hypothetical protein
MLPIERGGASRSGMMTVHFEEGSNVLFSER